MYIYLGLNLNVATEFENPKKRSREQKKTTANVPQHHDKAQQKHKSQKICNSIYTVNDQWPKLVDQIKRLSDSGDDKAANLAHICFIVGRDCGFGRTHAIAIYSQWIMSYFQPLMDLCLLIKPMGFCFTYVYNLFSFCQCHHFVFRCLSVCNIS